MNNYKELLDALDGMDFFCDRAGKELWFNKPKKVQDEDIAFHHKTLTEAINAIEQLVKERDAAIADLTELSNDLQSCKYCKNLKDDICTYYATHPKEKVNCGDGKFFKWRGVKEVEHGND